jgi:hypothetical protein
VTAPRRVCLLLGLLIAAAPGCGKKGPPLAPLVKVPAAPQDFTARRGGPAARIQLRVPAANADDTRPADLERVDVYGFTGAAPEMPDVVKYGTLVASIPVRRPPEAGSQAPSAAGEAKPGERAAGEVNPGERAAGSGKVKAKPPMAEGFDQDDIVTVAETLGPEQSVPVVVPRKRRVPPPPKVDPWRPVLQTPPQAGDTRVYFAVGVNRKGQRGTFTVAQAVPLVAAPPAPSVPTIAYDASGLTLAWTPPAGLPQPIQRPPAEGELPSTPRGLRAVAGGYNVYEAHPEEASRAAPPAVSGASVERGALPPPLNAAPLEAASFADARIEFGKPRCFVVRSVVQSAGQAIESAASPAACVTPVDTFPPEAPKGLAGVPSEGAISLIWEAGADADLAGYVVLRRDPEGGFVALTPAPIKETTFRDAAAKAGVRYVYTVVAVDAAGNRSGPSNAVEEAAR